MQELNERDGMKFHERIATQYGPVVKLNGFAGVSPCAYALTWAIR